MLSFFLPLHFPCIIIAVFLHVTRSFPPSSAPEPLRTTFPFSCSESSHYPQTASLTASLRSGVLQRPLHPCFVSLGLHLIACSPSFLKSFCRSAILNSLLIIFDFYFPPTHLRPSPSSLHHGPLFTLPWRSADFTPIRFLLCASSFLVCFCAANLKS